MYSNRIRTVSLMYLSLVVILLPGLVQGQTLQDGNRLSKEAGDLRDKAQTAADRAKVMEKYEQALRIFEELGNKPSIGLVANGMGVAYRRWGSHTAVGGRIPPLGGARKGAAML